MKFTFQLFLFITFFVFGVTSDVLVVKNTDSEFYKCVNRVIKSVFIDEETLLVLSSINSTFDIPNTIIHPRVLFSVKVFHKFKKFNPHFKLGIVIYLDVKQTAYTSILIDWFPWRLTDNVINSNVKWLLITPEEDIGKYYLEFWKKQMANLIVLSYNSNNSSMQLHTSNPQEIPNKCGETIGLINKQSCNLKIELELPKAMRRYTNCTITLCTMTRIVKKIQSDNEVAQFLMRLITTYLEATFVSTTASECPDDLILVPNILRFVLPVQTGIPYYTSKALWAVPNPKQIPKMEVLFLVFKKTVWIYIAISILITAVAWGLITSYQNNCGISMCDFAVILINIWELTLLGSTDRIPIRWALRFVFICYVIYCIHIQAVFGSKIVELLIQPQFERGIQNLDDLVESNISIIIGDSVISSVFVDDNLDESQLSTKIYRALQVVSGVEEFLNDNFLKDSRLIRDNFATGSFDYAFMFPYQSYLFLTINEITYRLIESGIKDEFLKKIESEVTKITDADAIVLSVDHLYIIFIFWITGLLISTITFILEFLVNK
ncbi:hypothetical protein FQR65_LT09651 [Abscondita terminalis]|nr:hypothetical protein FQR65_LT09651 [Abscondita terminalis]